MLFVVTIGEAEQAALEWRVQVPRRSSSAAPLQQASQQVQAI